MYPKTNACPVPDEVIKASGAVFDVIYNPRETLLMQKAKAMGKNAVGGMAMLVWQAVSAHEIMGRRRVYRRGSSVYHRRNGDRCGEGILSKIHYNKDSKYETNNFCAGFMGCGKSTVGKILA